MVLSNIKHLVIAGGAHMGICYYGALRTLCSQKFIKLENIQSIYATSVGTIVSVSILLNYDWNYLDRYILKTPWHKIFPFNVGIALKSLPKGGMYDKSCIESMIHPLLDGKNISRNVTLRAFHEINNKDIHFISTKYESFTLVDISHKTHPDWTLVDAVYASSCFPLLFVPHEKENNLYLDGAIYANYPINLSNDVNPSDEILGISFQHEQKYTQSYKSSSIRLLLFLLDLFFKLWHQIKQTPNTQNIPHQIEIKSDIRMSQAIHILKNEKERIHLFEMGKSEAQEFIDRYFSDSSKYN